MTEEFSWDKMKSKNPICPNCKKGFIAQIGVPMVKKFLGMNVGTFSALPPPNSEKAIFMCTNCKTQYDWNTLPEQIKNKYFNLTIKLSDKFKLEEIKKINCPRCDGNVEGKFAIHFINEGTKAKMCLLCPFCHGIFEPKGKGVFTLSPNSPYWQQE